MAEMTIKEAAAKWTKADGTHISRATIRKWMAETPPRVRFKKIGNQYVILDENRPPEKVQRSHGRKKAAPPPQESGPVAGFNRPQRRRWPF